MRIWYVALSSVSIRHGSHEDNWVALGSELEELIENRLDILSYCHPLVGYRSLVGRCGSLERRTAQN